MKKYFLPAGQLNRKDFLEQTLMYLSLEFIVLMICSALPFEIGSVLFALSFIPYTYMNAMSIVKRLHHIGRSGYHYFLIFFPIYNLFLFVCLFFQRGKSCSESC